ncbi:hypothetical protein ACO0K7_02220 [Undibacterium sp. Ji67W]|uniref:hypothetical protein n=1 Tax=Undibacterium sp. Ji67W TaxID=3413042 RepID=UPI003BF3C063
MKKLLATVALLFVFTSVFGFEKGPLFPEDMRAVNIALAEFLHGESDTYKIDDAQSGCNFQTCTSVVKRYANFSSSISLTDAPVLRKKMDLLYSRTRKIFLEMIFSSADNSSPGIVRS